MKSSLSLMTFRIESISSSTPPTPSPPPPFYFFSLVILFETALVKDFIFKNEPTTPPVSSIRAFFEILQTRTANLPPPLPPPPQLSFEETETDAAGGTLMAAYFSASLYFLSSFSAFSFFLRDIFSSVLTLLFPSIIASSLEALL